MVFTPPNQLICEHSWPPRLLLNHICSNDSSLWTPAQVGVLFNTFHLDDACPPFRLFFCLICCCWKAFHLRLLQLLLWRLRLLRQRPCKVPMQPRMGGRNPPPRPFNEQQPRSRQLFCWNGLQKYRLWRGRQMQRRSMCILQQWLVWQWLPAPSGLFKCWCAEDPGL